MKHYKKTMTMLLTAAVLLVSVFMTGCTSLTEPKNSTPSGTDALAESDGFGVYVKLERDDASSIALHGGSSFTKVCENVDGSLLKAGAVCHDLFGRRDLLHLRCTGCPGRCAAGADAAHSG